MKKTITTLLLIISINTFAQKDTVATASTPILSINDISKIDSVLQKKINRFELADYNEVLRMLQTIVNEKVAAYNRENKPKPKTK